MFSRIGGILYRFVEGMNQQEVVWYEKDYLAVRDGIGHTGSPEVESHFETVRKAIESPDQVKKDRNYANRFCYYGRFSSDMHYPNHHMKVVIAKNWRGKLEVATAYFTNTFKAGEQDLWNKS